MSVIPGMGLPTLGTPEALQLTVIDNENELI
jgi:hypothetical protein